MKNIFGQGSKSVFIFSLTAALVFGGFFVGGTNITKAVNIPIITVLGSNPATVNVGDTYVDAGATAVDGFGTDITSSIETTGLPIDTSSVNTFTVTYTVNITDGDTPVSASETRTVNVVIPPDTTPPSTPVHVSPANNIVLPTSALIQIDWTDSIDADSPPVTYIYEAANDPAINLDGSFVTPIYTSGALTESMIPTLGTPAGVYYWHVRAFDSASIPNSSPWTDAWKITVDNTPTTLTVNKIVIPSSDEGTFNLQIDETTYATGGDGTTTGPISFDYGTTHTISETGAGSEPVTDLLNYASLIGGACAPDGTITLAPGNNVCTITNTPVGPVFIDTNHNHIHEAGELYFTTIQAAVDYATDGDFIQATIGNYPEHVTVNKKVTINGAQVGLDARTRSGDESIVNGASGSFTLEADDIVLDGFTIQDATGGPGIETKPTFSGYQILNNIITNNVFGIYLHNKGGEETSQAVVRHNLFDSNNNPGASAGNGIYSDQEAVNILIDANKFTGDLNDSINVSYAGANASNITISNNEMTGEGAIFVIEVGTLNITGNTITNPLNHGIQLMGTNDVHITDNTITGVTDGWSAIRLGNSSLLGDPNSDVTITGNTITGSDTGLGINAGSEANAMYDTLNVHRNAITGHDTGVINNSESETINATCNWWGSADGPGSVGPGSGDKVTSGVTFAPWLETSDLAGPCYATLTIVKTADFIGAGEDTSRTFHFTVTGTGDTVFSTHNYNLTVDTEDNTDETDPITINSGTYNVLEAIEGGWQLANVSCVYDNESVGTTIYQGEAIEVDNGDAVTCTFTNTKRAVIHVHKVVINNNGGTATPDDFSFVVQEGDSLMPGTFEENGKGFMIVNGGESLVYNVTEPAATGYTTTYSEACGSITLENGHDVTCTITNDDIATAHTLTYTAGANGSITGTSLQTVNEGANGSEVTAVANSGFHFVNWSDESSANPRTDTNVTADISVTANFAANVVSPASSGGGGGGHGNFTSYTIIASSGSNGSISPIGSLSINSGSSQSFVIAPNSGFSIANVLVDGVSAGAVNSYTFNNVGTNHTISVTFSGVAGTSTVFEQTPPGNENLSFNNVSTPNNPSVAGDNTNSSSNSPEESLPGTDDSLNQTEDTTVPTDTSQPAAVSQAPEASGLWQWITSHWPWWLLLLIILAIAYYLYNQREKVKK